MTWFNVQRATLPRSHPRYIGRFAPSPTGALHAGSLVTALASWLDARAHDGLWLVRIEDLDGPRCVPGADHGILSALARLGLVPDVPPVWQSRRHALYQRALDALTAGGHVYGCACSRKEIADSLRHSRERHRTLAYPGTCRPENGGLRGRVPRAWRLCVPDGEQGLVEFLDRWQGRCSQSLAHDVGDFVLKRADGEWAYQLAVVVDDALQGVTDVVRGADLIDSTARQIWLHQLLGAPIPRYLHVPVVNNSAGEKLSKQSGAAPLDLARPLATLDAAARHLDLSVHGKNTAHWLKEATAQWKEKWGIL